MHTRWGSGENLDYSNYSLLIFGNPDAREMPEISNSNWTEWRTIHGVIAPVVSKSDEREAQSRLEITSAITP